MLQKPLRLGHANSHKCDWRGARLSGVLGGVPLGEGVMEALPWTLSLRSRVTTGLGCNQGEASPFCIKKDESQDFSLLSSLSFEGRSPR